MPGDCIVRVISQNGEARNPKASTQGYAEEQVACAAAAAAAAQSRGRRSEQLETACYLGKPRRSARRYDTRHGSGEGNQETGATHF